MISAKRTPKNDCVLRLYFTQNFGVVAGTGTSAGKDEELTIIDGVFNFSVFSDSDSPYNYAIDCVKQGTPIEVSAIPGFKEVQTLEDWRFGKEIPANWTKVLRPLDFDLHMQYMGLGCTHKSSSAERQKLRQGGTGQADDSDDFGPQHLPDSAKQPYQYVRYAPRPEAFQKATAIENSLLVPPGGKVGVYPKVQMVVETEIAYLVARRNERNKPPRMIAYAPSNDFTAHAIEAECTLYLPQAKTFTGCLSIGPCAVVPQKPLELTLENCKAEATVRFLSEDTAIHLQIIDKTGELKVQGKSYVRDTYRPIQYYLPFAMRNREVPYLWIQSGTGIMHPKGVSVEEGDTIQIWMQDTGHLITGAQTLPYDLSEQLLEAKS